MKKVLFVAGVALIGFSAAFAQDIQQSPQAQVKQGEAKQSRAAADNTANVNRLEPETIAQRKTERLNKELSFTEDQKQKVHAIFLKEAQENKGRGVLRQETDSQLKAIFTAEQNQKYEALKERRKQALSEGYVPSRAADVKAAPAAVK